MTKSEHRLTGNQNYRELQPSPLRPFVPPAIIHEIKLEIEAGSPLGLDLLDDPMNLGSGERR